MSYERLQVKDHVDKWTVDKLRHVEDGIIANEMELEKKQPIGDYALKEEIPDISNFTTHEEVQKLIEEGTLNMIALSKEEILNICKN